MNEKEIKLDLTGLDNLLKSFGRGSYSKVGIMGAKNTRKPDQEENNKKNKSKTNSDIGLIHELGDPKKAIPARSFLRFPLEYKSKELIEEAEKNRKAIMMDYLKGSDKVMFNIISLKALEVIDQAFHSKGFGQWKDNSPSTIAQKGSASPLIDTSQLRRAIDFEVKNGRS